MQDVTDIDKGEIVKEYVVIQLHQYQVSINLFRFSMKFQVCLYSILCRYILIWTFSKSFKMNRMRTSFPVSIPED